MVFSPVFSRRALTQSMQALTRLPCDHIPPACLHTKKHRDRSGLQCSCAAPWGAMHKSTSPDQVSRCSTICVVVGVRCTPKSTGIDQASRALVQRHLGALHKSTFTDQASRCSSVYIEL